MLTLFADSEQIITVDTSGAGKKNGAAMNDLHVVTDHSLVAENGKIKDILPSPSVNKNKFDRVIDLRNKIILPGLIECHTHSAFAGSRAGEFLQRLKGMSYEDIARAGGGILSTVKAVRSAGREELRNILKSRVENFISQGVTTLEIKSGYGLDFENEVKLLEVIRDLNKETTIDLIPTFLGAHTFPPEYKDERDGYIKLITDKMIPYIAENNLAKYCDAFCESTAFSAAEVDEIFAKAEASGMMLRLHTDQFNSIGGVDVAIKHKALSADHLEVAGSGEIFKLSTSDIVAVLLPGVSFFLDYDYAPARDLIDNGAAVALATDFNPGSSHIIGLNFIMSLAALKLKMTAEEIICAVTVNAAKALNLSYDRGSIEIGKRADLAVFDTCEYQDLIYNVGKNLNSMTVKNGDIIYSSSDN